MVSTVRAQRIADRIFEELSTLLVMEVSDPRLNTVSITHVKVDRELSYANIYVSSLEGKEAADEILAGLQHASGFLRHSLSQLIQLRSFPKLRFYWDPIPERADRIDQILDSLGVDDVNSDPDSDHQHLNGTPA